ncbi:hypothetical protein H4219_005655 [Mycoemilia scoparia]|uniref:Uncharacterized protein n=1 Tax=Mycoemilia scoparia TaxID=417184 RepID=A0A9W8DPN8_9FUNG|nr:hypothetical protein H4219_005655 [Mycoemilia scoparia]
MAPSSGDVKQYPRVVRLYREYEKIKSKVKDLRFRKLSQGSSSNDTATTTAPINEQAEAQSKLRGKEGTTPLELNTESSTLKSKKRGREYSIPKKYRDRNKALNKQLKNGPPQSNNSDDSNQDKPSGQKNEGPKEISSSMPETPQSEYNTNNVEDSKSQGSLSGTNDSSSIELQRPKDADSEAINTKVKDQSSYLPEEKEDSNKENEPPKYNQDPLYPDDQVQIKTTESTSNDTEIEDIDDDDDDKDSVPLPFLARNSGFGLYPGSGSNLTSALPINNSNGGSIGLLSRTPSLGSGGNASSISLRSLSKKTSISLKDFQTQFSFESLKLDDLEKEGGGSTKKSMEKSKDVSGFENGISNEHRIDSVDRGEDEEWWEHDEGASDDDENSDIQIEARNIYKF